MFPALFCTGCASLSRTGTVVASAASLSIPLSVRLTTLFELLYFVDSDERPDEYGALVGW